MTTGVTGAGSVVARTGPTYIAVPSSVTPAARDALRSGVIDRRPRPPWPKGPSTAARLCALPATIRPSCEPEQQGVGVRDVRRERARRWSR